MWLATSTTGGGRLGRGYGEVCFTRRCRIEFGARPFHFWIRAESKPNEGRCILLPEHCKDLLHKGHRLTVERSEQRCVPVTDYERVGCDIVPEGSWPNAPPDSIIMGLKEIQSDPHLLKHNHVFFGHCFKGQKGSQQLLDRFYHGKGTLWDLEFLTDEHNRRIAAFGFAAGMIGMALGVIVWGDIMKNRVHEPITNTFKSYSKLLEYVKTAIKDVKSEPTILIVGGLGRVGSGSLKFAKMLNLDPTVWDKQQTEGRSGPFPEILGYDIFVNTINLQPGSKFVFLDKQTLKEPRKLSVIADISCDQNNQANPIPIFGGTTDFSCPAHRVIQTPPLDIIAIDHLPSLVPEESSREFGQALLPHLDHFGQSVVWKNAKYSFDQRISHFSH